MRAPAAAILAALAAAACGDAAGRRADDVAALRDRAADGIAAVERFCAVRDTVIAAAERGDADAEPALEQVLLAPVVIDDYCEEFRFHGDDHDSHDAPAAPPAAGPPAPSSDTAPRTPQR